ncbi:hypothetical protein HG536_0A07040 [Torulaspora globosa]|uniref:Uncharacterized protein n=1 Tax=Torulaspora globosa TaxID=48254 RepID=A0A7G3ZBK3_9SACH|nr:uncharacterized protein HG536_0A07040 [Torulaspora globosa]QLL30889.1 hypothetical protein HG536_0A07040 [Torulaspora globosa]
MEGEVAMDDFPTTPLREGMPTGHNGSRKNEVVLQGEHLKAHPHGLSAKRRLEKDIGEESCAGLKELSDESLDCVRRSQEGQRDVSACRNEQKNPLDQIDINRMFSGTQDAAEAADDSTIFVKHSPIRFDMSSPVKHNAGKEEDGQQPKRLKLELECVPNLGQPGGVNGAVDEEPPVGSPEAIEMIEAKSSPMKDFSQVAYEADHNGNNGLCDELASGANTTPGRPSSCLHTLSPVHHSADANGEQFVLELDENDDGQEMFQMLTTRNEELIRQVHVLNQKLNKMMTTCDITSYRYKKMQSDLQPLLKDCQAKLNESYKELQVVTEERDSLRERTVKLKERIDENRDEVKMLNQNQSILQKKYISLMNEIESARNKYEELESKHRNLEEQHNEDEKRKQILNDRIDEMAAQISGISAENTNLKKLNEDLIIEVKSVEEELDTKTNEVRKLQEQLQEAVDAEKGANDQVAKRINELVAQRADLESQFENYKAKSETGNKELVARVREAEDRLDRKVSEVQSLQDKLNKMVQDGLVKDTLIKELKRKLEEANDKSEIDKAQVTELQNGKAELERINGCMESSIAELEESLREWQAKYDEQAEKQKLSVELEAIQLKNSNIEAEHLAELEQLHSNLSALQEDLKQNSKIIGELRDENESLRRTKQSIEAKLEETLQKEATNEDQDLVKSLQKELESWKEKYQLKEQESNRSLKLLAEDLYVQYSSKHEQKVKLLKKGYETKFQGKLDKLMLQNEGLTQEIEQVKSNLAAERKEKQKLIDLLESRKPQE